MMKFRETVQNPLIKTWINLNLAGWFLGLLTGPLLFDGIIGIIPLTLVHRIPHLSTLVSSLFFGACLGSMQQFMVRRWNVSPIIWILATAFGIAIPMTLISVLARLSNMPGYSELGLATQIAEIILMGLGIGGLQALVLRHKLPSVGAWVRAYLFGFPFLAIVGIIITTIALALAEPIEKLFYSLGLWKLVEYRDGLLLLAIGIVLPFGAAFCISLPTGRLLQSFFPVQSVDAEPTKAGLPGIKAG